MKPNFYMHYFDTLDSTNDEGKHNYFMYQDHSVIVAKKQTKGRGRFDRVWESEQDLTFSILYKHDMPSPLIFPLAVVKTCRYFHQDAKIKWPNDIVIDHKKVCGILIERVYEGHENCAMIVGIGVNLSKKSDALQQKATYLKEDANTVLSLLLEQIEVLEKKSQQQLLEDYQIYHFLYKKKILLDDCCYEVEEVQIDGSLKVVAGNQERYLYGEEITLEMMYKEDL